MAPICFRTVGSLSTLIAPLVLAASVGAQGPVISEIQARNATTLRDPNYGGLHDWIELHNPTTATVRLGGWYLTDDRELLTKWQIPTLDLAPGAFVIVYASGESRTYSGRPYHTSFQLDGDGEYVALVEPDGVTVASELDPPKQHPDLSYGLSSSTGTPGFFETPTPGAPNPLSDGVEVARKVKTDVRRGRFTAPFDLTLTSASVGAAIRYTTDGSKPTRTHGTLYTGPIRVTGTTIVRAVSYGAGLATSRPQTYSYLFYTDATTQAYRPAGFPATWGDHPDPWGVHYADYEMDPAIVGHATYGPMLLDSLESLPIMSVVMDVDDLFDDQTGIYANSLETGELWERPASLEVLYPRMDRQQQADVGIRIFGRGSRRSWINSKFSFRVLFKDNYGAEDLDAPLFGAGASHEHNTLVLRGVHGDSFVPSTNATYIRDMFVRDTEAAMGRVPAHGTFCHLFVNGLYWGLYNPSERPDAAFQAEYFGGKRGEYDVIKHFNASVLDGDRQAYDAAHAIASAGLGSAAAYAAIQEYIDVENLIDYILINFFVTAADWPDNNWYMARRRQPGEKFRFFTWDTEHALWWPTNDLVPIRSGHGPGFFYDKLRANPEFRMLFADRVQKLMFDDGPLTTASASERFSALMEEVRSSIVAESARWGDFHRRAIGAATLADWESASNWELTDFFVQRPSNLLGHLRNGGLFPSVDAPAISPPGGEFVAGQIVTLSATAGRVWFTTDGSDPRQAGGGVSPTAKEYLAPFALTHGGLVKARALDNGTWSPLTEHVFHLPGLVINEILADNVDGLKDAEGDRDDWIELINASALPVGTEGLFLTDNRLKPRKWALPADHVLQPGETLLVWADEDGRQGPLHANFKLDSAGEGVFLFDKYGQELSGFVFGPQRADVSLGWFEDGEPNGMLVTFPEPTPGVSNEIDTGRRLYNGRAQYAHPLRFDAVGTAQIGTVTMLTVDQAGPGSAIAMFVSAGAAYHDVLPASEVAFLVDPGSSGLLWLQADANGQSAVPLPLPGDPAFVDVRLYFQCFGLTATDVFGSNAIELVISR